MPTFQDNFWIWGQSAGTHHTCYPELPGQNHMDPAAGAEYLGVPNCCRVVMLDNPAPPFDEDAKTLRNFRQVVWSAIGAGGVARNNNDQSDLEEVLRQAAQNPNVSGAVLDDFFPSVEGFETNGKRARHSLGSIQSIRDQLHQFPQRRLDLWLVWYSYQLDYPVQDYVDLCDVVTLWTWKGSELPGLDENIEKLVKKTPKAPPGGLLSLELRRAQALHPQANGIPTGLLPPLASRRRHRGNCFLLQLHYRLRAGGGGNDPRLDPGSGFRERPANPQKFPQNRRRHLIVKARPGLCSQPHLNPATLRTVDTKPPPSPPEVGIPE